jgi:serine/threonine protein kinase
MSPCPSLESFDGLLTDTLSAAKRQAVEAHLHECPHCQEVLRRRLDEQASFLDSLRARGDTPATESDAVTSLVRRLRELPPVSSAGLPGAPPEPQPHRPAPPALTGYQVMEVLGRGGMAVVYKARHQGLKRLVALKMILAGAHASAEERTRFQREAEAVARLQHPHIVQVYEVGEQDGVPYLALEYVGGGTLAQALGGSPLLVRGAAEMVRTLAGAVHSAHLAGVVHRDLKPANVLLQKSTDQGQVVPDGSADLCPLTSDLYLKIADFGLARQLGDATAHTASGTVLGTPAYMAPEQAQGRSAAAAPAVDVYGLGAILYQALTGRPPFLAATHLETLRQVVTREPVSPRRLQPGLPRDLDTICLKCLEKEPTRRYPSAGALADDLRRFVRGEPVHARPAGPGERAVKWARRKPTLAALLAVSALALVGLVATVAAFTLGLARERDRARDNEAEARAKGYFMSIALAQREIQGLHLSRANELLADCPVEHRGWEWYYLRGQSTGGARIYLAANAQRVFSPPSAPTGGCSPPPGNASASVSGTPKAARSCRDSGSRRPVSTRSLSPPFPVKPVPERDRTRPAGCSPPVRGKKGPSGCGKFRPVAASRSSPAGPGAENVSPSAPTGSCSPRGMRRAARSCGTWRQGHRRRRWRGTPRRSGESFSTRTAGC